MLKAGESPALCVYIDWSKRWISQVIRVLKPDGTFWLAIGDEYAAELKVLVAHDRRRFNLTG